jgi:hypothetical protein
LPVDPRARRAITTVRSQEFLRAALNVVERRVDLRCGIQRFPLRVGAALNRSESKDHAADHDWDKQREGEKPSAAKPCGRPGARADGSNAQFRHLTLDRPIGGLA